MDNKPLITQSQRLLKQNPRDDIHDISHHQRVWKNAQIISKSINLPIDEDVLYVAIMWHDVMISKESLALGEKGILAETIEHLKSFMTKNNYENSFQLKVIKTIQHHNFFNKHKMSLEGKILYDADKLDVLNPLRYRRIIAGIKNKKISKLQIFLIAKAAKVWLKTMRSRYHFEVSRQLHDKLISDLLKDKEAIEIAKKFGVDVVGLVK